MERDPKQDEYDGGVRAILFVLFVVVLSIFGSGFTCGFFIR